MNMFRKKKEVKESDDVSHGDGGRSTPVLKSSMTFRRGRKNTQPEPKPVLDLATALPTHDDFRTSLLMSGLSARFSMLREQDDPNSKIGKASDDSVLTSKRQSRLADYGYFSNGLSDIAEVASIRGSIRPPFANSRVNSFASNDGYGTDEESMSMMDRTKPVTGNNLFGGRQKVYKIPMGGNSSLKNLSPDGEDRPMAGRAMYEDDITQSAFQKLREREKIQQQREQWDDEARQDSREPSQPSRSHSPPAEYNNNRDTTSTMASNPSMPRTSTAATSVTSQRTPSLRGFNSPSTPNLQYQANAGAAERTGNKPKRLYETGLDQHLHSQQFSAMSRLDSLSRQRNLTERTPSPSLPSPTNGTFNIPELNEEENKASHTGLAARLNGNFDYAVKPLRHLDTLKTIQPMSPPLSPPRSDSDDQTNLPIQPNDIGKATASGAFSKPVQPYDEMKYGQRQLQLQEGMGLNYQRKPSPGPRMPTSQNAFSRNRAESASTNHSGRSRSSSSAQSQFPNNNNRRMIPPTQRNQASPPEVQSTRTEIHTGTFLSSPNGSSIGTTEDVDDRHTFLGFENDSAPLPGPLESEHPALRKQFSQLSIDHVEEPRNLDLNPHTSTPPKRQAPMPAPVKISPEPPSDSLTLGPASGLSGMVRQHLRSESNTSSNYDPPSPGLAFNFPMSTVHDNQRSITQNTWEVNDWDQESISQPAQIAPTSIPMPDFSPKRVAAVTDDGQGTKSPGSASRDKYTRRHTRDGSTATQKERDEFANELANRRRRVQENLKSYVDPESRSASPVPGADRSRDTSTTRGNNALGMPKSVSSKSALGEKPKEQSNKAMKMLGIANTTMNTARSPVSSPNPSQREWEETDLWKKEEEMLRSVVQNPKLPPQVKAYRQARRDAQRKREEELHNRSQKSTAMPTEPDFGVPPSPQRHAAPFNKKQNGMPMQQQNGMPMQLPNGMQMHQPNGMPMQLPNGSPMHQQQNGMRMQQQRSPSRERYNPPQREQRAPSQESKHSGGNSSQSGSRPPSRTTRDRSSSDVSGGRNQSLNTRYRDDVDHPRIEGVQGAYENTTRMRSGSKSPGPKVAYQQSPSFAPSPAFSNRLQPTPRSGTPTGYLDGQQLQPIQTSHSDSGLSPRPSPITPFSVNGTPALAEPSPAGSLAATPTTQAFVPPRKRSVNKSDISEPTFVSSTSRITTVNLPPGASLQNGINLSAPPIPSINPRRRQTKTQTMLGVFSGKSTDNISVLTAPDMETHTQEFASFMNDDDDEPKQRPRQKLRKSSSEGGNLNARARAAFVAGPSPAVPSFPHSATIPPKHYEGGMF